MFRLSGFIATFFFSWPVTDGNRQEPASALQTLEGQLGQFSFQLDGLFWSSLPRISFAHTYLFSGSFSIEFIARYRRLAAGAFLVVHLICSRAVTALLQTGSTIVYGSRAEDVNMVASFATCTSAR